MRFLDRIRSHRLGQVPRIPVSEANIGNILVAMGFLTREELTSGIEAKLAASRDQLLGEVLIARGLITRGQLVRALDAQASIVGPGRYSSQISAAVAKGIASVKEQKSAISDLREAATRFTSGDDEEKKE